MWKRRKRKDNSDGDREILGEAEGETRKMEEEEEEDRFDAQAGGESENSSACGEKLYNFYVLSQRMK